MRSWCWSPQQALIWSAGAVFSPQRCLASLQKCYKVGREEDILPSQHIYIFAAMWGYSDECWQARQWSARTAESGHLGPGLGCVSLPQPYRKIAYTTFDSFVQLVGHLQIVSYVKTRNELLHVEPVLKYDYYCEHRWHILLV